MLKVGDRAPAIDAMTSSGTRFVLAAQSGLCSVVYFFPKAFTPGCTVETKSFRDNHVELEIAGATVVGISTDDLATQCDFARSIKTPFPMIGDKDSAISRAYDVLWPLLGVAKRVTYVINNQQQIEAVFHHELDVKSHRDDVLRFVNTKFLALRQPPR
jgi:peroxiredoxin